MARDLWEQVQQLFDGALQHSPEKRQEFLEQECGLDQELRREVESLLAAHDKSGGFMAEPVVAGMAEVLHQATSRLQPGDMLGAYKVLDLVGRGGMGEVYRARDTRLKRDVAIKVLPRALAGDRERLSRFEQEARSAAALNHPNIISIHDMGTSDGSPYIVSELLEGQNLREVLRPGPVHARKVLDYALQAARGLAAAHDAGIVHRDLKPENLFITKDGQLKILDFGLAKLMRSASSSDNSTGTKAGPGTEAGTVFGTVGYMSPEQVRGQNADHRSDIFSFGAILYELFSGKRAFSGESPADTMSAILHQDPPELTRATPPVHPAIDHTIRHCLEKNPLERFQSAHDLEFQLRMAGEGLFPKAQTALADSSPFRRRWMLPLVIALVLLAGSLTFLISRLSVTRELPAYKRLTFRSGSVSTARFSSDGRTIIYGAAWEGNPSEIFVSRVDSTEARSLGIGPSELLSVSRNGELAVLLRPQFTRLYIASGTLATVPLEGGTPREIAEDVTAADWAPDGSGLAIVRNRARLEFPIGKVLFQSAGWLSHPRFSSDGKSIAFIDHPGSVAGSLVTCDLKGTARVIARGFEVALGLAWSPNGKEVWLSGIRSGGSAQQIFAISRDRGERLVTRGAGSMSLHDIAHDGRMLFTRDDWRVGMKALARGSDQERDLSWFDWSVMGAISSDGDMIAFSESAQAVSTKGYAYVRGIRGTPAVRLGEGRPWAISPDKKWALVTTEGVPPQLILLPIGSGEPKRYPPLKDDIFYPTFLGDGKRILFAGTTGDTDRLYLMTLDNGEIKPALPEGVIGFAVSPDGKYVVARSTSDPERKIYDFDGASPVPIKGLRKGERVIAWGNHPLPLYVGVDEEGSFVDLFRLDPVTGQRRFWRRLMPSDPAGVRMVSDIYIAPEAQAYGYSYYRFLSELYIVEGLH